jgi:hypothetical protein
MRSAPVQRISIKDLTSSHYRTTMDRARRAALASMLVAWLAASGAFGVSILVGVLSRRGSDPVFDLIIFFVAVVPVTAVVAAATVLAALPGWWVLDRLGLRSPLAAIVYGGSVGSALAPLVHTWPASGVAPFVGLAVGAFAWRQAYRPDASNEVAP